MSPWSIPLGRMMYQGVAPGKLQTLDSQTGRGSMPVAQARISPASTSTHHSFSHSSFLFIYPS